MGKATDHEVVSIYAHSEDQREQMLIRAPECVLMWGTQDHWPVGVVHSFVWHDNKIWVTFAAHRHRAAAIERDPRVSVCISGRTSDDPECPLGALTVKGRGEYIEDEEIKKQFYRNLAKKINPQDTAAEQGFYDLLDSPLRKVLAITPEKWISFDADKSARHRAGTLEEHEMSPMQSADLQRRSAELEKRGLND
ncbi:MAG: hypothetical protein AAF541_21795 [Pseudomonadota bacterium]